MAAFLDTHKITEGATVAYFLANPSTYTGIATQCGVDKPSTPGQYDKKPHYSIEELLKTGDFERLTIYYNVAGKQRTAKIVAAKSKVATLLADDAFSYKGDTKARVRRPLRRYDY